MKSQKSKRQILTLGHSPDPDDAFLFYGMTSGKIDTEGLSFQHVLEDIETLNQRALRDEMDITAVSVYTYAHISNRYALLPYGASVGEKYGPVLVSTKPFSIEQLRSAKIASPGPKTTAQLVLMLYLQPAQVVFAPFDQIMGLVLSGKVDAGILIHEGQLTYAQQGLEKIVDLGQWWYEKTKLPLPLGVNVISKRLPLATQKLAAKLLGRSLMSALQNREEAIEYAMRFGRGLKKDLTDRFVGMYVNKYAQDLGEKGRAAIELLFAEGKKLKMIPNAAKVGIIYEAS
ncbi:MAG: ABC transporter substrate-binding protein [Candidatus Omnitrophica bacterium]|nr:ABC transporter substrate-binding protein [Candidatus Omnitrophota bacterium]